MWLGELVVSEYQAIFYNNLAAILSWMWLFQANSVCAKQSEKLRSTVLYTMSLVPLTTIQSF